MQVGGNLQILQTKEEVVGVEDVGPIGNGFNAKPSHSVSLRLEDLMKKEHTSF